MMVVVPLATISMLVWYYKDYYVAMVHHVVVAASSIKGTVVIGLSVCIVLCIVCIFTSISVYSLCLMHTSCTGNVV